MNDLDLLQSMPAASTIEYKLSLRGEVIAEGSEAAKTLARYDKARTALARSVAAATCKAAGFALAAAADGDLSADEARKAARECFAALEALLG
jgi:hypothetical protein